MSNFSGYKTTAFNETQKFFVLDPATGSPSFVQGSDLVSYITPMLDSVLAASTRLAAENTDYEVGTLVQTSGATSPGDGLASAYLVVAGGTGDFPMLNGNDLLVVTGDDALRAQLISNAVSDGSDLVAHTGTSDTVTEALDKRTIFVETVSDLSLIAPETGWQALVSGVPFKYTGVSWVASEGYVLPECYGFDPADSVASRTAAMNAAISSGYNVKLTSGNTYEVNALSSFSSLTLYSDGKSSATLRLANASDDHLMQCSGALIIKGVLVDQNYQNQTNRLKSAISHTGTLMVAWDCEFKNTMFAGIHVANAPLEYMELCRNKFLDMAEATGIQGEQTQAVNCRVNNSDCRLLIESNYLNQNTVVDIDAAPGGFIIDVVDEAVDFYQKVDILYNKATNIGQRKNFGAGTHFIGFIDFYTNCREANVVGNEINQYRYTPIKLQNSSRVNCSGNIVNGALDASAGAAIVFQNARDSQQAIRSFSCSGNHITLSGKTNDGIYIQGDPDGLGAFITDRVNVFGNTVYGADNGIRCSFVSKANFSVNNIELANNGYLFENTYPSGQVKYNINGGSIIDCDPRGVYLNGNGSNKPSLVVSGATFEDNVSFHIDAINAANLTVTGCDFEGTPVDDVRAQTSDFVVVTGNNNGSITANVNVPTGTLKQAGNSWS